METEIIACIVTEVSGDAAEQGPKHEPLLRKRKQVNSSFVAPSNPYVLTNTYARRVSKSSNFSPKFDAVTQRVLSSKEHKIKQLQSDLAAAQNKMCQILAENRLLSSLNKRNDAVLSRFQSVEGELPSLLVYHNSEVKALRERFAKLSTEHREQARELRGRDATLQATREQLANLTRLVEDKGLRERKDLATRLEEANDRISELEEQHKTLTRQLLLEKKGFKHHLLREQKRHREVKAQLEEAQSKISNLESKLKAKEKFITDHLTRKEFHQGRSVASFKSLSLSSSQRAKPTISKGVLSGTKDEEDDEDLESELSFSQHAVDSLMDHIKYSSGESDEEVSQIYQARPTSVPQLSLHTTPPWAVDSRTFSIRQTDTRPTRNTPVPSASSASRRVSTPVASASSASRRVSTPASSATEQHKVVISEAPLEQSDTPAATDTNTSNCVERQSDSPPPGETNNYSKEALLAALKAIDAKHTSENSLVVQDNLKINISERKAELLQELFGGEEAGPTNNVANT